MRLSLSSGALIAFVDSIEAVRGSEQSGSWMPSKRFVDVIEAVRHFFSACSLVYFLAYALKATISTVRMWERMA